MLNGGVAAVRIVAVPGMIGVLVVGRLSHWVLRDPFLDVPNGVFGDVPHVVVVQ
jgi:hypothetical protein